VDASVIRGGTQTWTWPFGYPKVRRWIWIQEFYQDDSDRLRMSFENDRWQNITREYRIFRRPHAENSERTDTLALAMPRARPHLKCCATLCKWIPLRTGLQEHVSEMSLCSRDSPPFSSATMNRNTGSECVVGITTVCKWTKELQIFVWNRISCQCKQSAVIMYSRVSK
jgi:hypothetical protein